MEVSKWDVRFLKLAEHVAFWSKDPSTKVGAVLANNKHVVSLGYNGFPSGIEDSEKRLNNREIKYEKTIHAELNAILGVDRDVLRLCTLYTWPIMPCPVCANYITQCNIPRVVSPYNNIETSACLNFKKTRETFAEKGITFIEYKAK